MKVRAVPFMLVAAFLFGGCSEKIPEGPEKKDVVQVELWIVNPKERYPQPGRFLERYRLIPAVLLNEDRLKAWEELTDYHVAFRVKVANTFDETIDGTKWIDIQVHLWEPANPSWRKTLRFRDYRPGESLAPHPAQTVTPCTADSLIRHQTDDEGKSIHETGRYHAFEVRQVVYLNRRDWRYWVRCDTVYTGYVDTVKAFEGEKLIKAKAEVKLFREFPAWESNEVEFRLYYLWPKGYLVPKYRCREGPAQTGGG